MELNEYSKKSLRTIPTLHGDLAIANASMGLCGEAGELLDLLNQQGTTGLCIEIGKLVDHLKKHVFHKTPLDMNLVIKEVGDVMFYLNWIVVMFGLSWDDILSANFAKLMARFPNGFNEDDANNRDLIKEEAAVRGVL